MQYSGNPNLYKELNAVNVVPGMNAGGMFGPGKYIDQKDLKLHRFAAVEPESAWIYTNPNPELYCNIYHEIESGFNFIPRRCLSCWKIVVVPRTLHELIELLGLQRELVKENPRCWCKCGVEHRDFVPRHYGGYFYTNSNEQGQLRYETVRKAVNEKISPNITVFLKRYCTEFELKYGPSNEYVRPEYANGIEKKLWPLINLKDDRSCVEQPGFIQEHVIQGWLVFAHGRGDETVTLYNDFKPLFAPPVTYHKE